MQHTQSHYQSDGHVVLTGHGTGPLTLQDGAVYDVTAPVVEVDPKHAEELAHLIGVQVEKLDLHPAYDAQGRGDKVPFVHEPHKKFAKYTPHPDNALEG